MHTGEVHEVSPPRPQIRPAVDPRLVVDPEGRFWRLPTVNSDTVAELAAKSGHEVLELGRVSSAPYLWRDQGQGKPTTAIPKSAFWSTNGYLYVFADFMPIVRCEKCSSVVRSGRFFAHGRRFFCSHLCREDWAGVGDSVYVIAGRLTRRIKIGFSTNWPHRIAAIAAASGQPIRVLAVLSASTVDEKAAHEIAAKDRRSGEWFLPGRHTRRAIRWLTKSRRARWLGQRDYGK